MTPGRAMPRALPTPNPSSRKGPMRSPRPWKLSEVVTAARAILDLEREAARARIQAGTPCEIHTGSTATGATAARWGKKRNWLEWLLKVADAAAADPDRLGQALVFLDAGGAPNVAWAWVRENDGRPVDRLSPLPDVGRRSDLISASWKPSDVNVAARALLSAALAPHDADGIIPLVDSDTAERRALTTIARLWGKSSDWLRQILDVCAAAEAEPDTFGRLVEAMNRSGRPGSVHGRLGRLHDERRILTLRPITGRFRTLVIDPPWDEDNLSDSAGHDYAQMSFAAIQALPVHDWCDEAAHLWLWATNNTLPLAFKLLEAWGFEHKAFHTWVKETDELDPKIGLGREFRNSSEHVLFARRGTREDLPRRVATLSIPTHHRWPVGRNSEKPEGFYELVRAASYGPYGEAFQRLARPDFVNLYESLAAPLLEAAE